ncbi:MAG TPA: hypothetical protein VMR33_19020 [Candidatus Baltobacteraceae bacterium]|jgi:hypothetical protein|nr:hypothetical protein [Candidatus Baltobacteraceae bacterium]
MAKKQKTNGALMTDEEKNLPMGLGYATAADRLGLTYLASAEVMLRLLVDFGNEAFHFSMTAHLTKEPFWKAMNQKADKLADILKGKNPAYMAISWFTEPGQLRASLYSRIDQAMPNDLSDAALRKDPIRAHARAFMAFFLELSEGAIEGQGRISDAQLTADHIRKFAGSFLGMDPAMLSLNLTSGENKEASPCG